MAGDFGRKKVEDFSLRVYDWYLDIKYYRFFLHNAGYPRNDFYTKEECDLISMILKDGNANWNDPEWDPMAIKLHKILEEDEW